MNTKLLQNRITKEKFIAIVEIPKASKNKYEIDKETGFLKLDRILFTSTHYPHNYGYIPCTLADDNDPLDVLILSSESIFPLTLVECKALGVVRMKDSGFNDEKIIAICLNDPFYNMYNDIKELPNHIFEEIAHFFKHYKELENKETEVFKIEGSNEAKRIIQKAIDSFKSNSNC